MVRTKKQVIDSLATKNKHDDSSKIIDHPRVNINEHNTTTLPPAVSEFYAPNVPTSPLPTLIAIQEQTNARTPPIPSDQRIFTTMPSIMPNAKSTLSYFEPPHAMNQFWPPVPSSSSLHQHRKVLMPASSCGKKLETTFSNLNQQEIQELMIDCEGNEDEAILRLITQTGYLEYIRYRISINNKKLTASSSSISSNAVNHHISLILKDTEHFHSPLANIITTTTSLPLPQQSPIIPKPNSSTSERVSVHRPIITSTPPLLPCHEAPAAFTTPVAINHNKATTQQPQTSNSENFYQGQHKTHKKHQRSSSSKSNNSNHGRLTLDDALQQIQDSNSETDGYAGWSAARLRAFKMIDKNPNSYYYRFNAPGEQQKKGKWTEEENALFLKRLEEVGANSQWGIFSIAIPGRVGYQCSNYYRFMIEMGQLHDPNYVLDEKGKARYLFDKKTEDGAVEKIFRKHSKHGSVPVNDTSISKTPKKRTARQQQDSDDDDDDDPTFSMKRPIKRKTSTSSAVERARSKPSPAPVNISNRRVTRQSIQLQEEQLEREEDDCPGRNDKKDYQNDHVVPN